MDYFSADRVRWVPFFGVPLAVSTMYEDTSSVTTVALDCFLAVFIQLGTAIGTLKRSMAFKIARNNPRGTATSANGTNQKRSNLIHERIPTGGR